MLSCSRVPRIDDIHGKDIAGRSCLGCGGACCVRAEARPEPEPDIDADAGVVGARSAAGRSTIL